MVDTYVLVSYIAAPGFGTSVDVYFANPNGTVLDEGGKPLPGVWSGDVQEYGPTQMVQWLHDIGARKVHPCKCNAVLAAADVKLDNGIRCRECGDWLTGASNG